MIRRILLALGLLIGATGALILFPQPLFAYSMTHGQFQIWSDRPIDPRMAVVLDDARRRIEMSELYDPDATFRIFLCNEPWRLLLLARSSQVGGSADTLLTGNIYLREADIAANRIVPPEGELADAETRPLSYFIAHEATHVMQSRAFGGLLEVRYPDWLTEGYADHIGKGRSFDLNENARLMRDGDPRLDYARSGLYRRYHLLVAFLMEREGQTIRALFENPPDRSQVEARVVNALL